MLGLFVFLIFSFLFPLNFFLKGVLVSDNLFGGVSSFLLLFALIWNFLHLSFFLFSLSPPPLSVVRFVFLKKKKEKNWPEGEIAR